MALTKIGIDAISGAIGTTQLTDSAVTSVKIANGTIATVDIADGAVTLAKTNFATSTDAIPVPAGTTAQRPVAPVIGMLRYNTDNSCLEQYTNVGWVGIEPPPTITSVALPNSQTAVLDGDVITINGQNFKTGCTVKFITSGGTQFISPTVVRIASTSLTAVITTGVTEGVYQLVVTNPSGLGGALDNALTVDGLPIFTTSSGSLGSASMLTSISYTIAATEDGANITSFAVTSGSLPSGVTLNSSTGVISGTLPTVSADTTYSFTITATDVENQKATRNFSITNLFVYRQFNSYMFG